MPRIKQTLSKKNEKKLQAFLIHTKMQQSNPRTLDTYDNYNRKLLHDINKDYDKITIKNIEDFYSKQNPRSAEVYKPKNKKFLIYANRKDLAKKIMTHGSILARPSKGNEAVLTPDEINRLIEAPMDTMDKALIETILATGLRNKETRYLNWNDIITTEKDCIKVNQRLNEGKIKPRIITIVTIPNNPCAKYPKYLVEFHRDHQHKNTIGKPLFLSKKRGREGERIGEGTIGTKVESARKRAKIEKAITPHILRHTTATYHGAIMNENVLCNIFGWETSSKMTKRYCHHQDSQTEQYVKGLAGITEEQSLKGRPCPRCDEINNINAPTCIKCHTILDPKENLKEQDRIKADKEKSDNKIKEIEINLNNNREDFRTYKDKAEPLLLELGTKYNAIETTLTELVHFIKEISPLFKLNKEKFKEYEKNRIPQLHKELKAIQKAKANHERKACS